MSEEQRNRLISRKRLSDDTPDGCEPIAKRMHSLQLDASQQPPAPVWSHLQPVHPMSNVQAHGLQAMHASSVQPEHMALHASAHMQPMAPCAHLQAANTTQPGQMQASALLHVQSSNRPPEASMQATDEGIAGCSAPRWAEAQRDSDSAYCSSLDEAAAVEMQRYDPDLSMKENPIYYSLNQLLFQAHKERLHRNSHFGY